MLLPPQTPRVRYLRAYPRLGRNLTGEELLMEGRISDDNAIKELEYALKSNSPFMQKRVCEILRQIINGGKLEQLQSFSTGKQMHTQQMKQAIENIKKWNRCLRKQKMN